MREKNTSGKQNTLRTHLFPTPKIWKCWLRRKNEKLAKIQKERETQSQRKKIKTSQHKSIKNSDAQERRRTFSLLFLPHQLSTQSCSYLTLCPIRRRDTVAGEALTRKHFLRPQFDYCSSMTVAVVVQKTAYCCCCFLLPSSMSWKTDGGGHRP